MATHDDSHTNPSMDPSADHSMVPTHLTDSTSAVDLRSAMEARSGTRTSKPLMDVFTALWNHSSDDHPLTPDEIIRFLAHDNRQNSFYRVPSREDVVNELRYLEYTRFLGREVRCVDADADGGADGEGAGTRRDADGRWYMAPVLSSSEVRLLEDGLMLSRIDPEELRGVISGLRQLAGGNAPSDELPDMPIAGYEHINGEFLATVDNITQAISDGMAVVFSYCDYDEHGDLVRRMKRLDDGTRGDTPRKYVLDPYNMVYKKGRYYLLGHFHDNPVPEAADQDEKHTNLTCFAVNRIRDLRISTMRIAVPARTWDENGLPRALTGAPRFDAVAFAKQRPHLTMGTLIDVVMSVGPSMLTNVYEWFDDPKVERVDGPFEASDGADADAGTVGAGAAAGAGAGAGATGAGERGGAYHYRVTVRSPQLSIVWWALQYALSEVRIESPQAVCDELRRAGALLTQRYGA